MKFEMNTEEFKLFCEQLTKEVPHNVGSALPMDYQTMLRKLAPIFLAVSKGEKINAIKQVRELTQCGLKEAKDCVEGTYSSYAPASGY